VHDIIVAHVVLKGSGVMPVVGKLVPGGVAKHVRVDREWKFCSLSSAGDHFQETGSRSRTTALSDEDVPRFCILPA
jgi:2-polyprenyl-6-methoxyphenol hydroxylase-like FAD-dependent oxidoreductase